MLTPEEAKARNKEAGKRYRERHRERYLETARRCRAKSVERRKEYARQYRLKNLDRFREWAKLYRTRHPGRWKESQKRYREKNADALREAARRRRANNPALYKLGVNIRRRISTALERNGKSAGTQELIGCTIQELRAHLEAQFSPAMTWENYGPVWHIDHKRPCASFDLSDPAQQRQCFHFSNMQPLLAEENLRKGDRWEDCGLDSGT
jgi:hypothetical protein